MNRLKTNEKAPIARKVLSFTGTGVQSIEKPMVDELSVLVRVNRARSIHINCSPWCVREAMLGALYMHNEISCAEDIRSMQEAEDGIITVEVAQRDTHASDAASDDALPVHLSAAPGSALSRELERRSALFHLTGGVHCAALVRDGVFLSYQEDVSRHVAVDKVIGDCLLRGIPMRGAVLVFSGRVPAEILQKAIAMRCAVLIARGTPTNRSCELAQQSGITLIGFSRENSFNVYTHAARIIP